jgi:hypothetical protein
MSGKKGNLFFVYERILNLVAEILIMWPPFKYKKKKLVRSERYRVRIRDGGTGLYD